jgi:3-hydroxybutyryl-CoA dehydrogenase
MTEQIEHIAVVGAGYMSGGIAQVLAMAGLDVVICNADPDLARRHLDRLRGEAEDFERQSLFITVIGKNRAYIRDILGALID